MECAEHGMKTRSEKQNGRFGGFTTSCARVEVLEPGGVGETLGVGAGEREDETSGPILCRKQTVRVAVNAFGMPNGLLTPDQTEEEAVKDTLLQRAPRMSMEILEQRQERIGPLAKAMGARLSRMVRP